MGVAQAAQRNLPAADTAYARAITLDPANAAALNNLGLLQAERREWEKAETTLRRAVAAKPNYAEAHFNLSRVLLMRGDYAEGWRENEWRWECPDFPSTRREFPYPLWSGEPLKGKRMLIWSEQGIGDEIMFANPIPDAIADAAQVVIECGARLVPIFRRSFPTAIVIERDNPPDPAIAEANIDFHLPMASLCVPYRSSKEAFRANPGRYLAADPMKTSKLRTSYAHQGNAIVGICWRSGNPIAGPERSAPLELWDRILVKPGCRFVSLQYGDARADIEAAAERTGVRVLRDLTVDPLKSAEDWFAQVAALDLVISIDNSTIQVSGSLGIPTFTLLTHAPEWRFGIEGSDHDWHPSIRVMRQPRVGEWRPVFAEVEAALDEFLARG
jgi:tetratricopeptide (TPR) repeat protein